LSAIPVHLLEHDGKGSGRDREVERGVAAGAVTAVEVLQGLGQVVEGVVVVEGARQELGRLGQPLPGLLAELGARAVAGRLLRELLELAIAPVTAGEAQQDEPGGQQPAVGEVVHGRDQLLASQVAGHPEHHEGAGGGDAGQAPVAGVAQQVRGHPRAVSSS